MGLLLSVGGGFLLWKENSPFGDLIVERTAIHWVAAGSETSGT